MKAYGLPQDTIDALEAPLEAVTFETIVDRLDEVFNKAWTYQFEGPEIVEVPKRVFMHPKAKNPRALRMIEVPHYQCSCQIILHVMDGIPIVREYTLQVPVQDDGSFEIVRDLSFIYAAHKGWGVGKRTSQLFHREKTIELAVALEPSEIEMRLKELASLKTRLGIRNNHELIPLICEWSKDEYTSVESITKANIGEFTEFLKTKVKPEDF